MNPSRTNLDRLFRRIGIYLAIFTVIALVRVAVALLRRQGARRRLQPPLPPAAPSPPLRGVAGTYQGARIPFDGERIVIGRDPAAANLVLDPEARAVSAKHCVIRYEQDAFWLEDCGSTNGTFLGSGQEVRPGEVVQLKPGDRFYLGDAGNSFEVAYGGSPR